MTGTRTENGDRTTQTNMRLWIERLKMTSPNDITIYYRLIVRETNQTRLRVVEVNEDRDYLEVKAKQLETDNPTWQVFVVRENYNVS